MSACKRCLLARTFDAKCLSCHRAPLLQKVLYFLRAFKSTGALIRMIFKVLWLSVPFLFVLLIVRDRTRALVRRR